MKIESASVYIGIFGDFLHRNLVQGLLSDQLHKTLIETFLGVAYASVVLAFSVHSDLREYLTGSLYWTEFYFSTLCRNFTVCTEKKQGCH